MKNKQPSKIALMLCCLSLLAGAGSATISAAELADTLVETKSTSFAGDSEVGVTLETKGASFFGTAPGEGNQKAYWEYWGSLDSSRQFWNPYASANTHSNKKIYFIRAYVSSSSGGEKNKQANNASSVKTATLHASTRYPTFYGTHQMQEKATTSKITRTTKIAW